VDVFFETRCINFLAYSFSFLQVD